MKAILNIVVACLFLVDFKLVDAATWQDGDTIIIDASSPDNLPRVKREQVVLEEFRKEDEDTILIRSDRCVTTRGKLGRCMSLSECYPLLGPQDPDAPPSHSSTLNDPLAEQLIAASGICSGYRSDTPSIFSQVARAEVMICCAMQTRIAPPLPPAPPQSNTTESDDADNAKAGCGTLKIKLPPQDADSQNRTTDNGGKIVNGREAQRGEFPWIVALMNNGREFCGGSLIDAKNVLTAAHCVQHMTQSDVQRLTIQIGDHDIYSTSDGRHEVRTASMVLYHKDFSMQHLHHDVALIVLNQPVSFGTYVQPVCMHSGSPSVDNVHGDVAGWGQLKDGGSQPSKLRTANVKIWSNTDCSRRYGSNAPAGIGSGMVCSGGSGKDSCRGDSGGPLTINSKSRAQIVGIVSWGIGCGSYPGVYTRVSSYQPWINKNRRRSFAE